MDAETFVPAECSLPTVEQPLRVAEFDELFRHVRDVRQLSPTTVELSIVPDRAAAARELARRESECCSFFTFTITDGDPAVLRIEVPDSHLDVLAGLVARVGARP